MSADAINEASKDDAPVMPSPLPNTVELMRGIGDSELGWLKNAVVRELNGEDEEQLSALGNQQDIMYTAYITEVLSRGVVSIGDMPVTKGHLGDLILPDRELLYLSVLKQTFGLEKEVRIQCPHCKETQDYVLELEDDFPILQPEHDLTEPTIVKLRNGEVGVNPPTAAIIEKATQQNKSDTVAEMNTHIIAQCVVSTADTYADRVEWAKKLGMADRKKLEKVISGLTEDVGPQLRGVETRCASCSQTMAVAMDWVSLLLG